MKPNQFNDPKIIAKTHWPWAFGPRFDPLSSGLRPWAFGPLISSLRILRDTFSVLMEGVPSHLDLASIGYRMASVKDVKSIHDLHVWTLTSGVIVLTAHVLILNLDRWQTVLTDLQQLLQQEFHIDHVTLQPEIVAEELSIPDESRPMTQ